MCVIAYKAKDVRFPSKTNIEKMWDANKDGAGIMWRKDEKGEIYFVKGFMKLSDFSNWIEKNKKVLDASECALHFRITTHGGTSAGNCHPFEIGEHAEPHKISGKAKRILMHNGILPLVPRREDISDSAELALRLGKFKDITVPMDSMNELFSGNRIVIMDKKGTHFYGDKFKKSTDKDNEGLLYSNLNWEFTPSNWTYSGFSGFGDYYYDYTSSSWREFATNKRVDFEDVDPAFVDDYDIDTWEEQYEKKNEWLCNKFGISHKDLYELEQEAEDHGMDLRTYLEYELGCPVCEERSIA